jgi:hypothetical protein
MSHFCKLSLQAVRVVSLVQTCTLTLSWQGKMMKFSSTFSKRWRFSKAEPLKTALRRGRNTFIL